LQGFLFSLALVGLTHSIVFAIAFLAVPAVAVLSFAAFLFAPPLRFVGRNYGTRPLSS